MGSNEEEGIPRGGCTCEGGYDSCRCDTPKVEVNGVPESLKKQIGGNHYKTMAIQPITYIMANDLGWCEGNAIKYVTRFKQKGGRGDIEKAIHYLQILLDSIE